MARASEETQAGCGGVMGLASLIGIFPGILNFFFFPPFFIATSHLF
jgi:hypothetical protein